MRRIDCKNCKDKFKGKYCPNCGQKAATNEINLKYFTEELPYGLFQVNKGLFFTIKELTIKPGDAIFNYIEGKRIRYFVPFSYIIVMASFFLLTKSGFQAIMDNGIDDTANKSDSLPLLGFYFLAASPFLAIGNWLLFRKKSKFNIWQYLIAGIYMLGHVLFLWVLMRFLFFIVPVLKEQIVVFMTLNIGYILFAVYKLHNRFYSKRFYLFFLSVLSVLTSMAIGLIVIGVFGLFLG